MRRKNHKNNIVGCKQLGRGDMLKYRQLLDYETMLETLFGAETVDGLLASITRYLIDSGLFTKVTTR